jgi:cyanate permease
MSIAIPIVLGPILAGMIFDSKGKYDLMFIITIGLLVVSIGSFMLAKPIKIDSNAKEATR